MRRGLMRTILCEGWRQGGWSYGGGDDGGKMMDGAARCMLELI